MKNNIKTSRDLMNILSEEIEKIRNGETSAAKVNSISNATSKIISIIKMELEYNRLTGKSPRIEFLELKTTEPAISLKAQIENSPLEQKEKENGK